MPFIPRLLHVTVQVPLATAVEKIANITLCSHIASWNPWLGRTTVRLRRTASICKYCVPVNHSTGVSLILPRISIAGTPATQPAITRSCCDDTTQVRYFYSPHPGTTINCYFRVTEVRLVPAAAGEGCIASKTENNGICYAILSNWYIIWLLLCCCCRCLHQQYTTAAAAHQHCCSD